MLLRGELQKHAKNSKFKNFESALYSTSGSMPFKWWAWWALPNAGFRLACRFAAMPRDHRLLFQSCSSQRQTPLWLYHRAASLPSWIEFNCLRSAAVGKAARLSIYWLDAACRLVIPLRQVALAQLNKYHHQSGNAASSKLVWNQHKVCI